MYRTRISPRARRAPAFATEALELRTLLSTYGVTDLGRLAAGQFQQVDAVDINNAGHIVGTVEVLDHYGRDQFPTQAFLYDRGNFTALPGLFPGGYSDARDINNGDVIVGNAEVPTGGTTAFIFANGKMQDLQDSLPSDTPWSLTDALAVNDAGLVLLRANYSPGTDNANHADPPFDPNPGSEDAPNPGPPRVPVESPIPDDANLSPEDDALILLDPATGKVTLIGDAPYYGINFGTVALGENGEVAYVAGFEDTGDELITHTQYWKDGVATDLAIEPHNYSTPGGFNAAGTLVGYAGTDDGDHPFLYKNGRLIDLAGDFPKGYFAAQAKSISDAGDVIGLIQAQSTNFSFEFSDPYVYHAGHYTLLNRETPANLALILEDVVAINRGGLIVANAQDSDGFEHSYLLTPHAARTDDNPVTVSIASAPVLRTRDIAYSFSLHFDSPFKVNADSILAGDVAVVPEGRYGDEVDAPTVVSVVQDRDGLGLTATYRFDAFRGHFRFIDNGDYDITLGGSGKIPNVYDANGNNARSQLVGHFSIALPDTTITLPNAGRSSMAYDTFGRLHVAYYDTDDLHLKYATRDRDGVWSAITTIDSSGNVGQFLSLALDQSDHPAVAYYDGSTADLKFAHFDGTSWTTETVDSFHSTGGYPSLAYDAAGLPAIAYWRKTSGDLRLARFDGTMWNIDTLDSAGNTGRFPSLKLNPATHRLSLAWEDHSGAKFKYAEEEADGSYTTTVVDNTSEGGGFCSLAFNPTNNRPAFSYYESGNAVTKFAYYDGTSWLTTGMTNLPYNRGLFTQLSFDSAGIATILYYVLKADAVFATTTNVDGSPGLNYATFIAPGGLAFSSLSSPLHDLTIAVQSPDGAHVKVDDLPPVLAGDDQ
jgi:probable HAF family extracellular repeat protein